MTPNIKLGAKRKEEKEITSTLSNWVKHNGVENTPLTIVRGSVKGEKLWQKVVKKE